MNVKQITEELRNRFSIQEEHLSDPQVREKIEARIFAEKTCRDVSPAALKRLVDRIFFSLRSDLGLLEPYIRDSSVSEIMVNGKQKIFIEQNGVIRKTEDTFEETEELEEIIRRVAARVHREINELHPIVDARLPDGSRVNAVYKNIAVDGPILTIRKFPEQGYSMRDLIQFGTLTEECADMLKKLVQAGYNCFISGGTSSGKTTFLNVLSDFIPAQERVIVIEDSLELQIRTLDNLIRMECRSANAEGRGKVDVAHLIRTSLRMRPDRIIVGEVWGGEVMDMLNAMNTGHDGSLSTGHGNSVRGMLRRLESMFLQAAEIPMDAIRSQIFEGIDIMIHLGRMPDRSRKVMEVAELKSLSSDGTFHMNILYQYDTERGLLPTGAGIIHDEKLKRKGIKT